MGNFVLKAAFPPINDHGSTMADIDQRRDGATRWIIFTRDQVRAGGKSNTMEEAQNEKYVAMSFRLSRIQWPKTFYYPHKATQHQATGERHEIFSPLERET
jgi:hypothetical protein